MSGKYLFVYLVIILTSGVVIGFCLGFFFKRNKHNVEANLRDRNSLFSDEIKHHDCVQCCEDAGDIQRTMILCPKCGNKRCPKALDHRNKCTGRNDIEQLHELELHNSLTRLDGSSIISNSK
jgi:uncharacterized membrane protein YraQ (UPF0718 family)